MRRFVRRLCAASVALLISTALFQSVRAATDVTVTVTQGGVGVEGAFVALVGSGATKFAAVTDPAGRAVFSQVPDGSYVAFASAPGTSAGSIAVVTPTENAKTIAVNGSGSVFSPLNVFGGQTPQIVADGRPGVFYSSTGVIPQIYRTADHGGTWAPVTISSDDKAFGLDGSSLVRSIVASGFPGEIAALTPTRVYYSLDFGVTWTSMPLPLDGAATAKIFWSHPAAGGALSTLFYAPANQTTMYYASMPTATNTTAPVGFTAMVVPYRANAGEPMTLVNGSDAGIFVVAATFPVPSTSPARAFGDLTLYKVSAAPHGNTDAKLTINNTAVPGSVPTVGTDGASLTASDMTLVRVGGPLSGPAIGSTVLPNTVLVYSVRAGDTTSNAALTSCTGITCAATTSTTFKDLTDATTTGSLSTTSGTPAVSCQASRASGPLGFASPRGDGATLGRCWLAKNGGSIDVRQLPNVSATPSAAFDSGYNGAANSVLIGGDGSRGPVKSARMGADATEGMNRPFFPPLPTYATAGLGATTGGVAVNGINSGNVREVAFNPAIAGQLGTIMSATGGGRVVASTDFGKTWFDIFTQGGDSLAWWNSTSTSQWILAGATSGTNLLAAGSVTSGAPFGPSTALSALPGTSLTDLGITGGTTNVIVPAVEGVTGTNIAIVSAGRTQSAGPNAGYLEGSLAVATLSSGPAVSISLLTGGKITAAAPVSLAYCDTTGTASAADKMFVAYASALTAGTTGSVKVITAASQSSRTLQSLLGITGDFRVVRADCATGTVWAGRVTSGAADQRGLLKSTDGGGTFSTITTTGRPNQILQRVQSLAIDPRAPGHVVVIDIDNNVVETKDGGFTWAVLNDTTTANCLPAFTSPCGHTFGAVPSTIKLPPRIGSGSSSTAALRATSSNGEALRASAQVSNDQAVAGTAAGIYAVTTRTVARTGLTFGGVVRGSEVLLTGSQSVNLSFATSGVNWTATSDQPFVVVQPASGTGNSSFSVSINNTSGTAVQPGTYNATITIQTTGALVSTQTITIAFVVAPASAAPIGIFDTPVDQSTGLQGSIAVSGWTLDDIDVDRVELWRDVAPGETTPPVQTNPGDPRNGKIFISNATFVDGSRPDVEAQFGTMPRSYRAGWGYLMLTWGLWNQGNGPFTLHAFALDKEGNIASIGTKTINVNNSAANKPFGSVDTPGIGATISGTVPNFGWGLTPKVNGVATCKIQSNGVQVSIDSGPLLPVVYGTARSDIAGAFTGFSNSDAAGGHYILDTTQFANGPHTIGWLITDDCNRADGVGSRFFNIQNGSSVPTASLTSAPGPGVQMRVAEQVADSGEAVTVAHGFGQLPAIVTPDSTGLRSAHVKQGDRIEMRLPRGYDQAYQLMNGLERTLPAGSSFDSASNTFYWQPAPGFLGSYELVFVRGGEQIRVRVFVDAARIPNR